MAIKTKSRWAVALVALVILAAVIQKSVGNPEPPDPDNDGLTTAEEVLLGTNPYNPDTDGDSINDGTEVFQGRNPKSPSLPGAVGDTGNAVRLQIHTPLK